MNRFALFERPFQWGTADCVQFVRKCVIAFNGRDYLADFPEYSSEREAARLLALEGGLYAAITKRLGAPRAFASDARSGDVALVFVPGTGYVTAFVTLGYAVIKTAKGVNGLPMERIRVAWSTGHA